MRDLARSLVLEPQDADDLVQDTYLAALRHPPHGGRPLRPWLATVIRNFVRTRIRDRGRHPQESLPDTLAGQVPTPAALLERVQLQRLLADLLAALDEPYRSTILLRYYEGLSAAEIARTQGIKPATVRWRLKHGLDQLRARLDERHGGDRRAWMALFAPFAGAPPSHSGHNRAMALSLLALASFLLIAGVVLWHAVARSRRADVAQMTSPAGSDQPRPSLGGLPVSPTVPPSQTPTGILLGRVIDSEGRPVAGALVAAGIWNMDTSGGTSDGFTFIGVSLDQSPPAAVTLSAADGSFQISGLPSKDYDLSATAPGFIGAFYTRTLPVAPADSKSIELVLTRGGSVVRGHVYDAGGGAIPRAHVRAHSYGPLQRGTFDVIADEQGYYEFTLAPESLKMLADADGYLPSVAHALTSEHPHALDFRLSPACRIRGRVVARGTLDPVSAATVMVRPVRNGQASITTDESGAFEIDRLPTGSYTLVGRKGTLFTLEPKTVEVDPATPGDVLLEVAPGPSIRGRVRTSDGTPVSDTELVFVSQLSIVAQVSTGPDGRYRVDASWPGKVRVRTRQKNGFSPLDATIDVPAAGLDGTDFTLAPSPRVVGRVEGADHQAVAGASVNLRDPEHGRRIGDAKTDSTGGFVIDSVTSGRVLVTVRHGDLKAIDGPFFLESGETLTVNLRLGQGPRVSGTVRFEDGAPAAGYRLMGAGWSDWAETVADGTYRLGPFPRGRWWIRVFHKESPHFNYKTSDQSKFVDVSTTSIEHVDFVVPRDDCAVKGLVVDPHGKPVGGARLGVLSQESAAKDSLSEEMQWWKSELLSDPDGRFVITDLPRIELVVWASHPDFTPGSVAHVTAGATSLRIVLGSRAR